MDLQHEFQQILSGVVDNVEHVARYAAERAAHLASIIGEPGYAEAVEIEVQNVALRAGISAVDSADAADAQIVGIITGALKMGAAALV